MNSPSVSTVPTARHLRKRKVRTGLALRSLIRMREHYPSMDADWPVSSIPSKDAPVDKLLVANGFQLALTSITNSSSPIRHPDRKTNEPARFASRDKRYSSQFFSSLDQTRRSPLKSESRLTAYNTKRSLLIELKSGMLQKKEIKSDLEDPKRTGFTRQPQRKEILVNWEDAVRDKEWLVKAKEQIYRDVNDKLARGNGLLVTEGGTFKYFIGKGNNKKLVKNIMQARWWWSQTENYEEANLIWTQSRNLEWFQGAEKAQTEWTDAVEEPNIACKVRFITDKAMKSCTSPVDISPLNLSPLFNPVCFRAGMATDMPALRLRTHNKLERTYHLSNKKALYINLKRYCEATHQELFLKVPLTFHIQQGAVDPEFTHFTEAFQKASLEEENGAKNLWIVKPGENTNRGTGITVCSTIEQVREELKATVCEKTGQAHTYIVQRYIDRPYLINKRKFDIRIYALITSVNGGLQGYYYNEGYLRTSSKEFSLNNLSRMIHLTNDAVQKKGDDYGRFEAGNKLSYAEFQRYLDAYYGEPVSFLNNVLPKIIGLIKDTMLATFFKLDPEPKVHSFEIYGYDFMLDSELKPWLIEVNTNPCLELSANTLARVIPAMLDNAFMIALDPYFQEPRTSSRRLGFHCSKVIKKNMFQLIFNSRVDGVKLTKDCREAGTAELLLAVDLGLEELAKDDDELHEDEAA